MCAHRSNGGACVFVCVWGGGGGLNMAQRKRMLLNYNLSTNQVEIGDDLGTRALDHRHNPRQAALRVSNIRDLKCWL